jgi:hypothetical protein
MIRACLLRQIKPRQDRQFDIGFNRSFGELIRVIELLLDAVTC